jgi:hypothetical protein
LRSCWRIVVTKPATAGKRMGDYSVTFTVNTPWCGLADCP